jgi:hypothetical protein
VQKQALGQAIVSCQLFIASQVCASLPLHRLALTVHVPLQAPPEHANMQLEGEPHAPASVQVSKPPSTH